MKRVPPGALFHGSIDKLSRAAPAIAPGTGSFASILQRCPVSASNFDPFATSTFLCALNSDARGGLNIAMEKVMKILLTALVVTAALTAPVLAADDDNSIRSGGDMGSAKVDQDQTRQMLPSSGGVIVAPPETTGSGLSTQEGGEGASVKLNPEEDKGGKDSGAAGNAGNQ